MADKLDIAKAQHADEIAHKQNEFAAMRANLQEVIDAHSNSLKKLEAENNAVIENAQMMKDFLDSIRDQINNFFAQIDQHGQNANEQQVVDVVTVESDTEDGLSEADHDNEDMEEAQEQPEAAENGANEVIENEQEAHEMEPVQQNLSNGDAHDETVQPNDDEGKENVRPQSTPIAKADPPAIVPEASSSATTVSAASIIVTVPKVIPAVVATTAAASVPKSSPLVEKVENIDEPGTSGITRQKKQYTCIFCPKKFSKKALVFLHWESVHGMKMKTIDGQPNLAKTGKSASHKSLKRKYITVVANEDGDDDADTEIAPSSNGHYVTAPNNPMQQAVKRYKKTSTKVSAMHRE
ncbi:uncharacterized protein LOC129570948 isoform X2 [Sitodiplosis mosellana]|nr:uncharacterized protein LOC129570948 isoform X2 [Sitodiplosis mosellana]